MNESAELRLYAIGDNQLGRLRGGDQIKGTNAFNEFVPAGMTSRPPRYFQNCSTGRAVLSPAFERVSVFCRANVSRQVNRPQAAHTYALS